MRKLLLLLSLVLFVNCTKEDLGIPIQIYIDEDAWDAYELIETNLDPEFYQLGTMQSFTAKDGPGLRFLGWRKHPHYCEFQPIVDPDDPYTAWVYMDKKYMGNCNVGPLSSVKLVAEYIVVF